MTATACHSTAIDPHHLQRALRLLALAAFASSASFRVCDPLLPELARSFAVSSGGAAQVITAFVVAYGVMQMVFGPLGERFDRYRLVTLATAGCAVGSLGVALAGSLGGISLFRAITGLTAAGIIPMSMAWIGDRVPLAQRQATIARFLSGQIIGMVAGQILGGWCADHIGWRWAFVLLAEMYLLIAATLWWEARRQPGLCGGVAATPRSVGALYAEAGRLLVSPGSRGLLTAMFLEALGVFSVLAFIPLHLHEAFGQSLTEASLVLLLYGVGGLVYSALAPRITRAISTRHMAWAGGLLVGLADLLLLLGPSHHWAIPAALLSGFGYYMLHNTLLTQVSQMAPQSRSLALALAISLFFLGQSVGVALAGPVVDAYGPTWVFGMAAVLLPLVGGWVGARLLRF